MKLLTLSDAERAALPARPVELPPLHEPRERVEVLALTDHWELRRFPLTNLRHTYLAMRGMDHVQLWHPEPGVSVLSPSLLTGGLFEIAPVAGWKTRAHTIDEVRRVVRAEHGLPFPSASALFALEQWFLSPRARVTPPPGQSA